MNKEEIELIDELIKARILQREDEMPSLHREDIDSIKRQLETP